MFEFTRKEFTEFMDDYPVFETCDSNYNPIKYQYSAENIDHFNHVHDLVQYQGHDGERHYWILKSRLK